MAITSFPARGVPSRASISMTENNAICKIICLGRSKKGGRRVNTLKWLISVLFFAMASFGLFKAAVRRDEEYGNGADFLFALASFTALLSCISVLFVISEI